MKRIYRYGPVLLLLLAGNALSPVCAQSPEVSYALTAEGSAASGDHTPFSLVSNQYGKIPLDAGNALFSAAVAMDGPKNNQLRWDAGAELIAATPRYRKAYAQQLYVGLYYKSLFLSVGSRERYTSLWSRELSSGDMVFSANARPIPEINISLPQFTVVPHTKGWMQVRGEVALGRSFDKAYLSDFTSGTSQNYVNNVLWSHKYLFVQIKDTKGAFPLSGIFGAQHWSQWGGTSTNPKMGKQPQGLSDFVRVFLGLSGDDKASMSDQINVLGNHYGSYDLRLQYEAPDWKLQVGYQHFFDDRSGMVLVNRFDGLWGAQLSLPRNRWLSDLVLEYMDTRNQSGPFHKILFDHKKYYARGGGNDNYYNNGEYTTGASYFGRAIGSPLIFSPEYNSNGRLGFIYNRMRDWHFGASGHIAPSLSYRLLFTTLETWGSYAAPLLNTKQAVSGSLDLNYTPTKHPDWSFTATFAADKGALLKDNAGFGLKIVKRGTF